MIKKVHPLRALNTALIGSKAINIIQKISAPFAKLPHLPLKIKRFFMAIVPWLVLIGGLIGAITTLLSLTLVILSLIALDLGLIMTMLGSMLLVLLNTFLLLKAFKPLRARHAHGWMYLFWANVLSLINTGISLVNGEIIGWQNISLTIGLTLVGIYVLFEIGPEYTYEEQSR